MADTGTIASGIWDNHKRGAIGEFLRTRIKPGAELSVVSAYFTIYAYAALKDELESIKHLRFLFGEPRFVQSLDPEKTEKKAFRIENDALALANRLEQKRIAAECSRWLRDKVDVRSIVRPGFLHGKMYHTNNNGVSEAIIGSSNFTVSGLGLGASGNNIELNLEVNDKRDRDDLTKWFDEVWNDASLVEDVKDEVLRYLAQLYQDHSPEFVYFKTLFHIFEDYLSEADKGGLLDEKTGFFESHVWNMLYPFQQDGVKGAINKILKHKGCIVADSVGLGKTFEALAVIKYFELLTPPLSRTTAPDLFDRSWHEIVKPGVIFCLRHKNPPREKRSSNVNPLGRYFLLYIRDDGTVRFSFTHPKNTLSMFRKLSAGKAEPYKTLCQWFDSETDGGRNMSRYSDLLTRAIRSIAQTYRKRVAAGLQSGRDFVIPDRAEQANGNDDFDLITWLVITEGA